MRRWGVGHVVEAETPLDAQPLVVGGAVAALHRDDLVVLDLVADLAADAAVGADARHLVERETAVDPGLVHERRLHQRPGRTRLHALPAGHAGARTHRVVEVEDDLRADAAVGHADDVVDLHLAARPHAEVAVDAGVEVDPHRGMAGVGRGARGGAGKRLAPTSRRPAHCHSVESCWWAALRGGWSATSSSITIRREAAARFGRGMHDHARTRPALARGGEHPLPFDLDHARAAVAVGSVAGLMRVAEMGDVGAEAMRHLPDRLALVRLDLAAVEGESNRFAHLETSVSVSASVPVSVRVALSVSGLTFLPRADMSLPPTNARRPSPRSACTRRSPGRCSRRVSGDRAPPARWPCESASATIISAKG